MLKHSMLMESPMAPRLDKPWESSVYAPTAWTLEEVALAAAADTRARIRAAASASTATPRSEDFRQPMPPWALVPVPMWSPTPEKTRHGEELKQEFMKVKF